MNILCCAWVTGGPPWLNTKQRQLRPPALFSTCEWIAKKGPSHEPTRFAASVEPEVLVPETLQCLLRVDLVAAKALDIRTVCLMPRGFAVVPEVGDQFPFIVFFLS